MERLKIRISKAKPQMRVKTVLHVHVSESPLSILLTQATAAHLKPNDRTGCTNSCLHISSINRNKNQT